MSDLLNDFFNRDLSETEEQSLGNLLASSPEHSLRFAALAHAAYLQTGLPDEGGDTGGGGASTHLGPIILKVLGLLAAAGIIGYAIYLLKKDSPNPSVSLPPALTQKTVPVKREPLAPKKITVSRAVKPTVQEPLKTLPLKTLVKPGMVNPVAYDPSKNYDGLDVMVEQKTTGLVTVRALDGQKNEVRLLFAGMLKPGKWDFVWDGKAESGEPAQPGTYRVEVQSGKDVLSKEIVIRGEVVSRQK